MDVLIEMHLRKFIQVRAEILRLLDKIKEYGFYQVAPAEKNLLVFWDKNNRLYCEDQYPYKFAFVTDDCISDLTDIKTFVDSMRSNMIKWGLNNPTIVDDINKTYDLLMGIMSNVENSYSPTDVYYLQNRNSVWRKGITSDSHFVTHIDEIPEYLPITVYGYDNEFVDLRTAVNQMYLLKCCFDPSIDYQLNDKYKQEDLLNEHNSDTTV